MANERLRKALTARSLSADAVAARVGVDSKSVRRWIAGRTPHPRHRWAVAALVGEDDEYLWPTAHDVLEKADITRAELLAVYPHRADVPPTLWRELLEHATSEITILVYAALFLPEQQLDLVDVLRAKAAGGCQVRMALGDPKNPKLLERGGEERFGTGIGSRAELALLHYAPLKDVRGVEIRTHGTTLYNSVYRFDDVMLVNTHVWGVSAFAAPVLHLRRLGAGGLFDTYAQSFEAVWATSSPAYPLGAASA
jgi:transcriptional regulator with XRE-family HTH domain